MFKLIVQKIGFRWLFIVLLLGIVTGQQIQAEKYKTYIASVDARHEQVVKLLKLEHKYEVDLMKKVIRKYSGDVKKDVKLLYRAQVNTGTSYSNRACETDSTPNITASNDLVADYTIAVSRDLKKAGWTFGKLVYIEELGIFARIQDVMNKRFCRRIDVFNTNTKEALKFGKRELTVYLLDDIEV